MSAPFHGGDLAGFSKRFGIPEEKILDFSSNTNPLGIPESVRSLFSSLAQELEHYPDVRCAELKNEIAQRFGIFSDQIILGNGAMGVLSLAVRALKPRCALLIEPSFCEYRRLLELEGCQIREIILKEGDSFQFSLPQLLSSLEGVDLLMFGHPNNPTGTALRPEEMRTLLRLTERRGIFVVADEAFADWRPEISCLAELESAKRLLVVRSFTKFFSIPGIRAGFALGARELIAQLERYQETWSMNRLAQRIALTALRDETHERKTRDWFQKEAGWFDAAFRVSGLKIYPSLANFFLLRLENGLDFPDLFEFLGSKGIYVRPASGFAGLDANYFRLALRLRPENEFLRDQMKEWVAHKREVTATHES